MVYTLSWGWHNYKSLENFSQSCQGHSAQAPSGARRGGRRSTAGENSADWSLADFDEDIGHESMGYVDNLRQACAPEVLECPLAQLLTRWRCKGATERIFTQYCTYMNSPSVHGVSCSGQNRIEIDATSQLKG